MLTPTLAPGQNLPCPPMKTIHVMPFPLPSICQKKVTAAFDGGRISSDGGVLLLAGADKRLDLVDTLAAIIPDHRHPALITHSMSDILLFCEAASSPLLAVTPMPTTSTICVAIPPSSWPVAACRRAAMTCTRNRRCHAGRMRPTDAR